jgi:hypothetical protein
MALTGRRPAEIFFSAPSASLDKDSPISAHSSSTANWKTRQAPGTGLRAYPRPVLADSKTIVQALDRLRDLKSFPSSKPLTPPLARSSPSTFFRRDLRWSRQCWNNCANFHMNDGSITE